MANAELLEHAGTAEEDRSKFSRNILSMTYQMRALVENLLEMARVDNGSLKIQFAALDFSELVSDAVLSFQLLYEENGHALQSRIPDGITLQGSQQHLYQVMDILLDNALKYSVPGGLTSVELKRIEHSCLLTVANTGEPLSREDLTNIFKRFYRTDKARSFNGSYGLGLSIAESIVQSHKGKIWAESEGRCNTFFVQLPLN
jgi:signal transduction histidine kinase